MFNTTGTKALEKNLADNFQIPWSKCPQTLLDSIENGKSPGPKEMKQLIMHTMSDVFSFIRRASRENLRHVARKIVSRCPDALADYINGQKVGDGVNSIMLQLESGKENMNRNDHSSNIRKFTSSKTVHWKREMLSMTMTTAARKVESQRQ